MAKKSWTDYQDFIVFAAAIAVGLCITLYFDARY